MQFIVQPSKLRDATITVPGDKSISHRALMLGSIAQGRTQISGFLEGEDCHATLAAMHSMGVNIEQPTTSEIVIHGVGLHGLAEAKSALDLGNSGTAMRLMAGLLSGQPFTTTLTGDASLTERPMQRVITPLEQMGAQVDSRQGKPPLTVRGRAPLRCIDYPMPMASAQVKSAVLLAGMYATGQTTVIEPAVTRDHTERMLRLMGARVAAAGGRVSIDGGQELTGCHVQIPADLSSAAFMVLAGLLAEKADILVRNVGVNPTRTGVINILQAMGADIGLENQQTLGEEPVADLRIRSSKLRGCRVDPAQVSLAIDEFPVLFVAAAAASGTTVFSGLRELRVKESDRIATMATGLRTLGIDVEDVEDGAIVHGGRFTGGSVDSQGDHRVAMSLAIAATVAEGAVTINDVAAVNTSFPGFDECLGSLHVDIRVVEDAAT